MKEQVCRFLKDERGDMAEKAVVWVLIILAAVGAFALLGGRIAEAVMNVASNI
jgi:Flp pilus assembly pilin Flp